MRLMVVVVLIPRKFLKLMVLNGHIHESTLCTSLMVVVVLIPRKFLKLMVLNGHIHGCTLCLKPMVVLDLRVHQ
jgi:hypothetical protein